MSKLIPQGTLVVVADGGSARMFTNVGTDYKLVLKQEAWLEGQDMEDQGPSGSMPKESSQAQLDEATFAKQLAAALNAGALNNRYSHLLLVADPKTLGHVRPLLHKATTERLLADVAKDLTNMPLEEIQRALS